MTKPRKHYRPKPIRNPLDRIAWIKPLEDDEQRDIAVRARMAYQAFRSGIANLQNAESLGAMVNIAGVVAFHHTGHGKEAAQAIVLDAYNALARATAHEAKSGHWLLDGRGLQAVADAIDLFEEAIAGLSAEQYLKAIEVAHRMERDEASNPLVQEAA
jgi:hypothetical protein